MNALTFEVLLRTTKPELARHASIAAARFIALLPTGWRGELDNIKNETTLIIQTPASSTVRTVRTAAESALTDPAMRGWELADCRPLPASRPRYPLDSS